MLEVLPKSTMAAATNPGVLPVDFTMTGLPVSGAAADNLCVKAYQLLKKDFAQLPPIHMHLHKVIPMGAGLGGGSADAAFALRLLNQQFHLQLSDKQLMVYALQLGSDCPFFITNKPCFATGRGEKMEEIALNLKGFSIMIINPGIHINTGWAFGQIQPQLPTYPLQSLIQQPIETWKDCMVNDFEQPVTLAHPIIGTIKNKLYQAGAVYASMSGSGSTVYGIFKSGNTPTDPLFPQLLELRLEL